MEIVDEETEEDGIVLNPDDENLMLTLEKAILREILEHTPPENEMLFYDGHISELSVVAAVTSNFSGFKNISWKNSNEIIYAHFMKKISKRDNKYLIYSPLAFYKGANKKVIFDCCQACLDLAKKYHITTVVFPLYFAIMGGTSTLNAAVCHWFNKNKNYGMTVIVATGTEEEINNGKERNFFKVTFADDVMYGNNDDDITDIPQPHKNIPANKKSLRFDYSKGKSISTSEEAKQKAREFKNQFADVEDFYKVLKDFGFKWKAENSNSEKIKTMWALNALACAIDEHQFDPFLR